MCYILGHHTKYSHTVSCGKEKKSQKNIYNFSLTLAETLEMVLDVYYEQLRNRRLKTCSHTQE